MRPSTDESSERDRRLHAALADCLEALEQGRPLDAAALAERFPEFAREITEFLGDREQLAHLAGALRPAPPSVSGVPTKTPADADGDYPPPPEGTSLGEYQLFGEIGRGGMATVYRARQAGLNRWVALKMVELSSEAAVRRFRAEAEMVAQLDHPRIVPVYEIGEHCGRPFFTMKLMEGGSLAETLARRATPYSPREAARLLADVAKAVHHAHQHGVLHRDIKPGNILLDAAGQPHVADFGLARRTEAGHGLTQSGAIIGTPGYMAPEQAAGRKQGVTAGDVYSLGAVLYELLTGSPPFRGKTPMETLLQVMEREPTRPRSLRPYLPADLETVCLKCLEKNPDRRYASAGLLAEDLELFLNGEPVRARPVGAAERVGRWCRRYPLVAGLLAALFVVFVVGVAGISWKWREADLRREEAEGSRRLADENAAAERTARLRAESLLVELGREQFRQALMHLDQGKTTLGMLELGHALKSIPASSEDLRRVVAGNLSGWRRKLPPPLKAVLRGRPLKSGNAGPTRDADTPVRAAAFSLDGRTVVTGGDDRTVRVFNLHDGQPLGQPLEHPGSVRNVVLSADGRLILAGGLFKAPRLWDTASGKLLREFAGHASETWALDIRSDGKAVLTGGWDRTARLWDADTGRPLGPPLEHPDWVWSVAFSPDGRSALTGCRDRTARLWDLVSGKLIGQPLAHPDEVMAVAFSPDGRRLVTACMDGTTRLWDRASGEQRDPVLKRPGRVIKLAFDDDGVRVRTCSQDGIVRLWDPNSGECLEFPLPPGQNVVRTAAFSPDGKSFLTAGIDGEVHVLQTPGGGTGVGLACNHWVSAVAFSPDGRTLLTGYGDLPFPFGPGPLPDGKGEAELWDLSTRRPFGRALPHAYTVLNVAFSPDGSRLLTGGGVLFGAAGEYRLWDGATGKAIGEAADAGGTAYAVSFDPTGRTFVVGTGRAEAGLAAKAFALIGRAGMAGAGLGNRLNNVSGSGRATIYDTATGKVIREFPQPAWVTAAAFSPDGKILLTGGADGRARLWDVVTGQPAIPDVSVSDSVLAVAFSHDGGLFATGSGNGVTRLWNARTGEFTGRAFTQQGWVRQLRFSPDDSILLSAGEEKVVRLWDLKSGEPLGPPLEHQEAAIAAAFSPDGRQIATGGCDKMLRLWETPACAGIDAERSNFWLQVHTGMELDRDGVPRRLDPSAWWERRRQLDELGGPPGF
jgi:WD40 repeat protein